MCDIEQRFAQLERRLESVEGIFRIATGFDPNLPEHTENLRAVIAEYPGMSQNGVARIARERCELSRSRVTEVLRCGVGKFWRVEAGAYNSLLFFPIANGMHAEAERTLGGTAVSGTNHD